MRRRRPWRLLWRLPQLAVAYLLLVLLMMWLESLLVYPIWQIPGGDWNPTEFACEDVEFASLDGTALHGWYFAHPHPQALVLYCHGNGEHVAHLGPYMDLLRERFGVAIFAFDYRGYGKSQGKPHQSGVLADAQAAQAWLAQENNVHADRIVLWGRSIGGAVAVHAAVKEGARGLILERTFTSLPEVAAHHYRWLPVRTLMRNRFDAAALIGDYRGPLLQSHGTVDEVVPFALGQRLFALAPSDRKEFVALPGVSHNAPNPEEYYTEVARFFERLP